MTQYYREGTLCKECPDYIPNDKYVGICQAKKKAGIFAVKGGWGWCNLPIEGVNP